MIHSWEEHCEVSSRLLEEGTHQISKKWGRGAVLHIFLPNCPCASFVTIPVASSVAFSEDVLIHPIMFDFLSNIQTTLAGMISDDVSSPEDHKGISVGPLPLESQQNDNALGLEALKAVSWQFSALPIDNSVVENCTISVSFIFLDDDMESYRSAVHDDQFILTVKTYMLGRLIKVGSVLLLATEYGFAIVEILSLSDDLKEIPSTTNKVVRLPSSSNSWHLKGAFGGKVEVVQAPKSQTSHIDWEDTTIPGYESLREELLKLASLQGCPAAPSGVLVTGVPGVGKTRMAASFADSYTCTILHQSRVTVHYISVQHLIFQASTQSDILGLLVGQRLASGGLWIIDDLHLLEREGSNDTVLQHDSEYIITCEALLRAIDILQDGSCFILGICHVPSRLPQSFTTNGRLEKHFEMMAPTQHQRFQIWENILLEVVPSEEDRHVWSKALASNTPGTVAADLQRIYRDAWTRCWARNPQEEGSLIFEWNDIREAARACVPSQLVELDVTMPRIFDSGLSWNEIHAKSWDSLAGYEKLKRDVYRQVVIPWKQFLTRSGNASNEQYWVEPPSGVLFYGPSGCGKSKSVECLAASLELPMLKVRASDILDKWLGGSEALLRSLFSRARAASPCILFFDEIDAIACNRTEDDFSDSSSRILSTLLNEMDGVSSGLASRNILVVGCTNRLETLDAALLRPGRLHEHFELPLPQVNDIGAILFHYAKKIPIKKDLLVESLAIKLATRNITGADVEGFIREICLDSLQSADVEKDDCFAITQQKICELLLEQAVQPSK